ncbi:MAG: LPS export ABC transporter permease LptF [Thermodesulfobacteriota bacterium]
MPSLISRYIFKEIAGPFLLSCAILTATALLTKVLKLAELVVSHGVGLGFALKFLVSVTPPLLVYTVPASFLVAVLIASSRMSSDNEIIAMKASGLGLFDILKPVLALAVLAYALTLVLTLYLFPWGNHNVKKLIFEAASTRASAGMEERTFYDRFPGVVMYVDTIPPGTGEMRGVFISQEAGGEGGEDGDKSSDIIWAESGVFVPSEEQLSVFLQLRNGTVHRSVPEKGTYHIADFSTYTLALDLSGSKTTMRGKSSRELYIWELMERAKKQDDTSRHHSRIMVELHKRFATPASVFVFSLIGLPLGIQRVRRAGLTGFGLALGVLIVYYTLVKGLEGLGDNGLLHPALAAWGADLLLGAVGGCVLYMAARDRPIEVVPRLEEAGIKLWKVIARRLGI